MTPADIRATRKRLRLTQAQLAERLPSSLRTVQDWEAGVAHPPGYLERALRDLEREIILTAPAT